jgi:probable addiction module antidote protein
MKTRTPASAVHPNDHNVMVVEMFREDPQFAAEYLNQVLEEGDQEELLAAMRRIADAFGGVPGLAKRSNLHAKTLYRTLSPQGNPQLKSLSALLNAMGMRIAVAPLKPTRTRRSRAPAMAA